MTILVLKNFFYENHAMRRESTPNKPSSGDLKSTPKDKNQQPCLREACQIQTCLQNNNYQESRCQKVIEELFKCCEELIKSGGESPSCSKIVKKKGSLV
ncbi:hypothetical protein RclHR1_00190009 [Rhizophagus clarus]|uniref:Cx9C motif-containing protein 4, mitochondrial n=1 Tax=Rhizophagus clarus TaxID=94130 RepID=A0A2Z6RGG1_9GLOM|nr:hypothetical protein RclHR1_00190009 [Rhizophagus clarus]